MQYRKLFFLLLVSFFCLNSLSQTRFSLSTDASFLRSFKKNQQYWAIGQTVTGNFHFTPKNSAYIFFTYYSDGKFSNQLIADARLSTTQPAQQSYNNKVRLTFRHMSIGLRHYFKNTFDSEKSWGVYGIGGFGLMMGRVTNTANLSIDTAAYKLPVSEGEAHFKRLTVDLGLGYEAPLGGDIYIYLEGRSLVPVTDYPSEYLYVNGYVPITASVQLGLRVLF